METKLASEIVKGDKICTHHYGFMTVTHSKKRRGENYQQIQGETEHRGFKQIEIRRTDSVQLWK